MGILLNILDIVTKRGSVRRPPEPFLKKNLKTFITEHICMRGCDAQIVLTAHQQFYLVFSVIMLRSETDHLVTHQLFYAKHPYFSTGTPLNSGGRFHCATCSGAMSNNISACILIRAGLSVTRLFPLLPRPRHQVTP